MENRDVAPDDTLLKQIFNTNQPHAISIFQQDWDKCIFKAEWEKASAPCVVRLEDEDEKKFTMIAAMHQLAAAIIPKLVPKLLQVGKARNDKGRTFNFMVVDLVEGDTLENVWQDLDHEQQSSITNELVDAIQKLHSVRLSDDIKEILYKAFDGDTDMVKCLNQTSVFGGPHTGLLYNGTALLESINQRREVSEGFCTMTATDDGQGIKIESKFVGLEPVLLDNSDIMKWPEEAIFCHNDLAPCNIIVQSSVSPNGKKLYRLSGIIDWELSGFYPAAYELSLQDTYLGCGNQHLSFYLLLKDRLKELVPRYPTQIALLRSMELVFESHQRYLYNRGNIPAHIRKRFMQALSLTRDSDPYVGWVRRPGNEPSAEYSRADVDELVKNVIKDMRG
ncbi:hypothetical protein F4810DRAFT_87268 [Camillea tinctor]|nr:hypothetical protein F4810DRAFT_87268 [Camillea tinctor]